jgi:hypothetical protein
MMERMVRCATSRKRDDFNIHSKQLCVPFRIFLRVGKESSFGILVLYRYSQLPTHEVPVLRANSSGPMDATDQIRIANHNNRYKSLC